MIIVNEYFKEGCLMHEVYYYVQNSDFNEII